jgi:hypothetical protein
MRATNGSGGTGGDIGVAATACAAGGAGIYGAAQTSQTGPIIAGVVAIIVALVTWYATDRRQAKAITAQSEQQARELEAEQERLVLQLSHERDLKQLDHLREFFDEAAAVFENALATARRYAKSVRDDTEMTEPIIVETGNAALDAAREMNVLQRRMGLRLPTDHPVYRAYDAASDAFIAWRDSIHDGVMLGSDQIDDELGFIAVRKWRKFVDQARTELERRAATAR